MENDSVCAQWKAVRFKTTFVLGGVSAAGDEERCKLLFADFSDTPEKHAQSHEEHAESNRSRPEERQSDVHFLSPFI